jgi:ferredoxin
VASFERARIGEGSIGIGIGGPLARMLKGALTSRPQISADACRLCGNCAEICPPDAISMDAAAKRYPQIDRRKCIRCFCCQEVCPHNAIAVRPGWLLRLLSVFRR